MEKDILLLSSENQIHRLSLNRPQKCNALSAELVQALSLALEKAAKRAEIKAVLLCGEGKHFCAGADLLAMQKAAQDSWESNRAEAEKLANLFYQMYTFPKPLIALAQGATLGGGLGLLLCCDAVIATTQASFCFSEAKIGLAPSIVSPYALAALGERRTRYYFLSAQSFGAQKALDLGLIEAVVKEEDLEQAGMDLAQSIAKHSPGAVAEIKQLIISVKSKEISPSLAQETAENLARIRASKEGQEGLAAFLEKREPSWHGG